MEMLIQATWATLIIALVIGVGIWLSRPAPYNSMKYKNDPVCRMSEND